MKKTAALWIVALTSAAPCWLLPGCTKDTTGPNPAGDGDGDNGDGDGDGDGDNAEPDSGANGGGTRLDSNVAGKACESAQDCGGTNTRCANQIGGFMGFGGAMTPGGYCTGDCSDDSQCGEGGVCSGAIALASIPGSCMKACETDNECSREGYECVDGLSLPADAGVGGLPPQPSTCQPIPETVDLGDGVAGSACTGSDDCGGGTCANTLGGAFGFGGTRTPGGYCTGACTEDSQCGAGASCIRLISFGNMPGSCYRDCGDGCNRDGYECGPVIEAGGFGGGGGGFDIPEACVPEAADEEDAGPGGPEPDAGGPGDDAGPDAGA